MLSLMFIDLKRLWSVSRKVCMQWFSLPLCTPKATVTCNAKCKTMHELLPHLVCSAFHYAQQSWETPLTSDYICSLTLMFQLIIDVCISFSAIESLNCGNISECQKQVDKCDDVLPCILVPHLWRNFSPHHLSCNPIFHPSSTYAWWYSPC